MQITYQAINAQLLEKIAVLSSPFFALYLALVGYLLSIS